MIRAIRTYATETPKISITRPRLKDILPKKSFLNRALYDLKADHSFGSLYKTIESIYKSMGYQESLEKVKYPKWLSPTDLMNVKHCLEKYRIQYKRINKNLFALENELLKIAVQKGDPDAKALSAYYRIIDSSKTSKEELMVAQKQLQELYMNENNILSMKLLGDLASKGNNSKASIKFYSKYLSFDSKSSKAGEVYCSLGEVYFKEVQLQNAEECFLQGIKYSKTQDAVKAYYYLGQLYTVSDPVKSKQCFELCASEGFVESLSLLGFLEMNYFGDFRKAKEWFNLGKEIGDLKCFIGSFDLQWELKNYRQCHFTYKSLQDMAKNSENAKTTLETFEETRKEKIALVLAETQNYTPSKTDETRWDL